MKCMLLATIDLSTGAYEIEFRNVEKPGEGVNYDEFMPALRKVLADFDARMANVRKNARTESKEKVQVLGDDQPVH